MKLSELRELENCPGWLKSEDIHVFGEDLYIDNNNTVIWKNGTWESGVWENGVWSGGTWKNGSWKYGVWVKGIWEIGNFENGLWKNGVWKSGNWMHGIWEDGEWRYGTWKSGTWKYGVWKNGWMTINSRCKWTIAANHATSEIKIGCKIQTVDEWVEWFNGKEIFETPRGTRMFADIYNGFLIAKETIRVFNSEIK